MNIMDRKIQKRIDEYIESCGGMIRTSAFQKAGFHNSYLNDLMHEGTLIRIKSGLYISSELQSASGFFEIQLAVPKAVICLGSALAYYELTTYEPTSVHIAIPRDDRTRLPDYPPVRKFSFTGDRYSIGQSTQSIEGHDITIYDREKSICDAIRFRNTLGQDVVNEAVRKYLQEEETNTDKLIQYSRMLKVEGPVQNHLRLMT
jgi:predicted transcriptional regulator of viral defense system